MTPQARIRAAIEILEHVQSVWASDRRVPIDGLLNDIFRARRYMGAKDRGAVSELVYYVLRNGGALEWHIEQSDRSVTPRRVVMIALLHLPWQGAKPLGVEGIDALFSGGQYGPSPLQETERRMLERCAERPLEMPQMPDAARYNYPDWMESRLVASFGEQKAAAMAALNAQAPVDLRCNTLKCPDRAALILALDREGHFATPTPHSPLGVRLGKRLPAFTTQAFKDGMFEMQDEGSQMAALLVEAKPGQKVIDFCAGAGGKTLAIAATMENKGRILAWDNHENRLAQMRKRLARAGVNNVQTHVLADESDPFTKRHRNSADWVLVDAPCSGSGTWRRNPDLKWRISPDDLRELCALQSRILGAAARLVKPGGRLVYVTCSIFLEENFHIVKTFLDQHPTFRVEAPGKLWNKHLIAREGVGASMVLTPHRDGTDGFYAAVLLKDPALPREA